MVRPSEANWLVSDHTQALKIIAKFYYSGHPDHLPISILEQLFEGRADSPPWYGGLSWKLECATHLHFVTLLHFQMKSAVDNDKVEYLFADIHPYQ